VEETDVSHVVIMSCSSGRGFLRRYGAGMWAKQMNDGAMRSCGAGGEGSQELGSALRRRRAEISECIRRLRERRAKLGHGCVDRSVLQDAQQYVEQARERPRCISGRQMFSTGVVGPTRHRNTVKQ
jgi:hypothetical protein